MGSHLADFADRAKVCDGKTLEALSKRREQNIHEIRVQPRPVVIGQNDWKSSSHALFSLCPTRSISLCQEMKFLIVIIKNLQNLSTL